MKQRLYLINNKVGDASFRDAVRLVAREHGTSVSFLFANRFAFHCPRGRRDVSLYHDGKRVPFRREDRVFVRAWGAHPTATALLSIVLRSLGIRFVDERVHVSHGIRSSKLAHAFILKEAGIASPNTWVATPRSFPTVRARIEKDLRFPLVVKTKGSKGKCVWKCDTRAALDARVAKLRKSELILFQEYVPNESDIRAIVFDGALIGGIERSSKDGFYNNIAKGASARLVPLSREETRIAKKAAHVVGLDLAGVDIVRSAHGPLVFEVNKAPDISGFNDAAGFNIAEAIFRRYLSRARS
ncbi:MAG TPA: hypothetical protein VFS75_03540 [Candidatus Paceibacterota bacterium]|nr:hypothetical protein [Candidatus Paceibacterota bacterium]